MRWSISAIALLAFLAGSGATTLYFDHRLAGLDRDLDASSQKVSATWKQTLDISEQITQTWKDRAEKCETAERSSESVATILYDAPANSTGTISFPLEIKLLNGLVRVSANQSNGAPQVQVPDWVILSKVQPMAAHPVGVAPRGHCAYFDSTGILKEPCAVQVAQ